MPKNEKPTEHDLIQSERFMQVAREFECDDDPERFRERVRKVAKSSGNNPKATKVPEK
jgi:hypothetical protein